MNNIQELSNENSTLSIFFHTMISEIYWSEKHLGNVLHTMKSTATTDELKKAFDMHMSETHEQLRRIEQIFDQLGKPINERSSLGMQGLFDEGWRVIDETEEGSFQRDVALVIAAQKVEHYEIACYGSLINLATLLGYNSIVGLLKQSLEEEKATDAKLTKLAEEQLNKAAKRELSDEPTPISVSGRKKSSKAPLKEERETNVAKQGAKGTKSPTGTSKGSKANKTDKMDGESKIKK
ncbi:MULTISPECIES: YciE/YciF ferroxidase family protein [Olivibacter]|uniref:Ferritin-like domain-containing protein n=1 Tax=Olivibacter oleidegradans TaxID=760123 RepID=A0ABV6HKP4_9SPHI|nr:MULTISPECIES: DUF892 family protein [Olivibacter]MCL4638938.1 DUF892 family protein [Olivibacter sp. UJ_SKK_5.1]MDM8175471.1 DUF892 family protein [Olivibacter sp. 47]MDX3914081.1 DUF892 family protein [Pseudosphingobacterium sp.]QEL02226.1 DUF892 family protein [Olivibacter sp. LS-1]